MSWHKKGLIFHPSQFPNWMASHAQVPTVLVLHDRLRIYFSSRTYKGKSRVGYVDVDRQDPSQIILVSAKPVLDLGKPGTFDDDGVMPSDVIQHGNQTFMYYTGWNQRVTVPFHNSIGLAVSGDGGDSFGRLYDGPILDRNSDEPYFAVTPKVLCDGLTWHMWYSSGIGWQPVGERLEAVYVIKYAHSVDGLKWIREPASLIERSSETEVLSNPVVLSVDGIYCMWFCFRQTSEFRGGMGSYRIGYAESVDRRSWTRMDEKAGLNVSDNGWDSEMTAYPYVLDNIDGRRLMFYNGNGFGQSGIGWAEWIKE